MLNPDYIPENSLKFPQRKPLYGIELRPHKPSDFIGLTIWAILMIAGIVGAIIIKSSGDEDGFALLPIGLAIAGLFGVGNCLDDPGGRRYEASKEGMRKFAEWEANELIPFLEAKYGIKFAPNQSFLVWGFPTAYKDNRSMEVNIHGIDFQQCSFSTDEWFWFPTEEEGEEVWIEEIVRTRGTTTKSIEPV